MRLPGANTTNVLNLDMCDISRRGIMGWKLLTQLMIDHGVGVTEESRYIVKKIDLDYFNDE
jgi:hypothetical protein